MSSQNGITRRQFFRSGISGASGIATTAATGEGHAQSEANKTIPLSEVEVIEGAQSINVSNLPDNTLQNVLIRANGSPVQIRATGSEWTIRNVGVQGPVTETSHVIKCYVDDSSGGGVIDNIYIDDVPDNCVFVNADHAGQLDITNSYFGKSTEDSVYGSPPGNGAQFDQLGKDPGQKGTIHIDNCYSENAGDYGFRLGSTGSSVTNSVVNNAGTALANLYGEKIRFKNVDVLSSGTGLKIGDHDATNARLLTTDIVQAICNSVRINAEDTVQKNDLGDVNAKLVGEILDNPIDDIPAGIPLSAEAAARGQSSARPVDAPDEISDIDEIIDEIIVQPATAVITGTILTIIATITLLFRYLKRRDRTDGEK